MDFVDTAARKLLRGFAAAITRGVAAAAGDYSFSLRQLVKDIFPNLLPLEALWRWTQTAVSVLLPVALVILLVAAALVTAGAVGTYFLWSVAATGAAMMQAPCAAGFLIFRAAFLANPQLYFHLLRTVGAKAATVAFAAL